MHYELVNEEYHLYNGGELILNAGKEVSISYTYSEDDNERNGFTAVLYKHGSNEKVLELHNDFIARMSKLNKECNKEVFDVSEQYMITGKFDLEELNKVLSICDYIGKVHKNIVNSMIEVDT